MPRRQAATTRMASIVSRRWVIDAGIVRRKAVRLLLSDSGNGYRLSSVRRPDRRRPLPRPAGNDDDVDVAGGLTAAV